jgi:predicted MFS family arabinose efflux permease
MQETRQMSHASRAETSIVYAAGAVQGIVLVTFPAASTIFTDPDRYDLSIALTAFWAMVTVGRVLFAAVERWLPVRTTYRALPFLLAATFVVIAVLPNGSTAGGILAFGVAGLGCSALLPLTIGFGEKELAAMAAAVTGGVIAFYQLGYGIAAFGVGPLLDHGVSLPTLYGLCAIVAVAMGLMSFGVVRGR